MHKLFILIFIFLFGCTIDDRHLSQVRSIEHPGADQQWLPLHTELDTILIQDAYGSSEYFQVIDRHIGPYYLWKNLQTGLCLYNPGFSSVGDTIYRIDGVAVGITIQRF